MGRFGRDRVRPIHYALFFIFGMISAGMHVIPVEIGRLLAGRKRDDD
jgi:hypothetical protein